jgi:Tfp pilus assembly protein PilP
MKHLALTILCLALSGCSQDVPADWRGTPDPL